MISEPFSSGTTLLHKSDARVKIIGGVAISLVLATTSSCTVAGFGAIITALLLLISRPAPGLVLKRIATVNIFSFVLLLTLPLSYGGTDLLPLGPFHISMDGLRMAGLITLKTNAILFCFLALLATSSTVSLGHALGTLGLPRKLVFLLLFSYRQLFVIHQEYLRLQRAAQLRAFVPANSLHSYRTYSYLFGMTLVKSWNRAERVHQAMILRGFNGRLIPLNQPALTRTDYLILAGLLLIGFLLAGFSAASPVCWSP